MRSAHMHVGTSESSKDVGLVCKYGPHWRVAGRPSIRSF